MLTNSIIVLTNRIIVLTNGILALTYLKPRKTVAGGDNGGREAAEPLDAGVVGAAQSGLTPQPLTLNPEP